MTTAIILAAGYGRRMLPLTLRRPISLLPLKRGVSVLDLQIRNLKKAGVNKVVLILGYQNKKLEKEAKKYRVISIETVYNPFFKEADNLVSLWVGREFIKNKIIVINGDDIFHPDIIKQLQKNRSPVCVVVDKKNRYLKDEMKVGFKKNKLIKISKEIPLSQAGGRSVGIIKFQNEGINWLKEALEFEVEENRGKKSFWLKAVERIIIWGKTVDYLWIKSSQWQELDYPSHFKKARKRVDNFLF